MYEDYLFEIHGSAPAMYRGMDLHIHQFIKQYGEHCEFVVKSVENNLSIPSTLFFLSKINSRFKKIEYIKKNKEVKKSNPERKQLIEYLANNMEMSKREIIEILDNKRLYKEVSENAYRDLYVNWDTVIHAVYSMYKEIIKNKNS